MDSTNAVVIPLSKKKIWLASVVCVVFIVIGFLFVLRPWSLRSPLLHALWVIRAIGFVSLIVFGYFLGAHITKLRDRSPGLIINMAGIQDNSTDAGPISVPWEEITDIYVSKVSFNKFMVVKLKSPEAFIDHIEEPGRKKLLTANYKVSGSPISIPSSTLKCTFKELDGYLKEGFEKYKRRD